MNTRRTIFYILTSILGVILFYNYIFIPLFDQSNRTMGMGMHGRMMGNYNYSMLFGNIIFIAILIALAVLVFHIIKPFNSSIKCVKCGFSIEDSRWKICPICGTPIKYGKGDRK